MIVILWLLSIFAGLGVLVQAYLYGMGVIFAYGTWIGVGLTAGFGFFAAYRENLTGKWLLAGWTGAGLGFLVLIPYSLYSFVILPLNYPPGKPFEEKLTVKTGTEQQAKNFYRLNKLLKRWDEDYDQLQEQLEGDVEADIEAHKINERTLFMVNKSDTTRTRVIDFYADNRITIPEKELTVNGKVPRVIEFFKLYDLELIKIKQALRQNEFERAKEQYLRLWQSLANAARPPVYIIQHLVNQALISKGINFYTNQPRLRSRLSGTKFVRLLEATRKNLRRGGGRRSLAYEYVTLSSALDLTLKYEEDLGESLGELTSSSWFSAVGKLGGVWPLYDYWKTRREIHDLYYRLAQLFDKDYYKIRGRVARTESKIKEKIKNWGQPGLAHLENPIGKVLIAAAFPQVFDIIFDTAKNRSKLNMLIWFHQHRPNFEPEGVPIDELTGKPYEIESDADTFVIRSLYNGPRNNGEPVQLTVVR